MSIPDNNRLPAGFGRRVPLSPCPDMALFVPAWRRWAPRGFEVIFLAYLVGIAAGGRTFAHLHLTVHGVPLFTGELALLTLTVLALSIDGPRGFLPRPLDFASAALLLLLAYGGVLAVRGLIAGYGLAALRDYALVYYGWFFFLARAYLRFGGTIHRILGALLAGSVAGAAERTTAFLVSPSLGWSHGSAGYEALYAWAAVVILLASLGAEQSFPLKALVTTAILVCFFVIFLSGYRTMLLVMAASLAVVTALAVPQKNSLLGPFGRRLWIGVSALVTVVVLARSFVPPADRLMNVNGPVSLGRALGVITYRWSSYRVDVGLRDIAKRLGLVTSANSELTSAAFDATGSVEFRENAWRHAIQRILRSPWVGIGFGTPAILHPAGDCDTIPSPTSNCGAAHNTYLMLAMRLGVPAAVLICAILLGPLARTIAARRNKRDPLWPNPEPALLLVIGLSFLVFGTTSLLLESPYLSSAVWTTLAAIQLRPPQEHGTDSAPSSRLSHANSRAPVNLL